ncbi:MAG: hypothetical protein R2764_18360 [Bacteroidales bacterium]
MMTKKHKYNSGKESSSKENTPQLYAIDRVNPFHVPEHYFESLPTRIQERVVAPKSSFVSILFIWLSRHPKYSLSFIVTAIAIVWLMVFISEPKQLNSFSFNGITIDDILNESPELIYDLDESQIIDVMMVDNDKEVESFFKLDMDTNEGLTDDDLIEYLNDENFETEIFYNL